MPKTPGFMRYALYICDPDRVSVPQPITITSDPLRGRGERGQLISRGRRNYAPQPVAMERVPAGAASFPTLHNELSVFYELKWVTPVPSIDLKITPNSNTDISDH